MAKESKQKITKEEKERRNRIFFWAVVVIAVNTLSISYSNIITQIISTVVTAYALYRVVVYDNKKNRYSRKYYDRAGRPLAQPKTK